MNVHTTTDLIRSAAEALIRRDTPAIEDLIRHTAGWMQMQEETDAQQTLLHAILEAACLLESEPSELEQSPEGNAA